MNKLFLIIILLFIEIIGFSQNNLTGSITSSKGTQPLSFVNVYITDLKIGAVTGSDGKYSLSNIPTGTYLVEARLIGYAVRTEKVVIEGNVQLDFDLTESSSLLQEVVVTGNSIGSEFLSTPAPITEVPNSYLHQNASTNIIDALSKIPGVSGITNGQSISKPVIRGLGYNRVVTVNDGVRQEGQQWGDEFGIAVDPNSVDRVEILKGPASLIYGSDAISGVLNLIPEKTLPEGQTKGDVNLGYQSNNGLYNTTVHAAGNKKGVAWSARISNIMAHAYQNKNDGYVANSQFSNFAYDATVGLHRSWGFSQLHYSFFNMKTGIVEGTRDSTTGAFTKQALVNGQPGAVIATHEDLTSYKPYLINQNVRHAKLVWDNSIAVGKGRMIARFAWQQNRRQEYNDITIPNTANIYYLLNTVNYDIRYVSPDRNNANLTVGINGMRQNSTNLGTLLLIPEYTLFDLGAFAIANKKIGKFNVSGGLRYDVRQFKSHDSYVDSSGNVRTSTNPDALHRFTAYSSNFNAWSGSFGATYQLSRKFYLKANVARGFRAPNVAETGSNGIHDGTVVYEIGHPTLQPEFSVQFDLAPGFRSKDVTAEIDLFSNRIDNYIYPVQLKSTNGGDSVRNDVAGFPNAPVFKYVQSNALLTGGEATLDLHPSSIPWLNFYTAYSRVDAQLTNHPDSTRYLPFIPPARLRSEVTVTFKKVSNAIANMYMRFGVFHSFEQAKVYQQTSIYYSLPAEEGQASKSPTDQYTLLKIGLGGDIMSKGQKILSIFISVDNLTDVAYKDYMSRFKYYPVNFSSNPRRVGVYNMGRNVSFKVIIPLDFSKK